MPRLPVRCMLFFSSYSPLALIFSILFFRKNFWLALGILLFSLVCLLGTIIYIKHRSGGGVSQGKIKEVQRRDENVMSYIATYLIPFVTFQLDSLEQGLALIVFILVLLLIYVNSTMIYVNPVFNLAGFHLYEVNIEGSTISHYLMARSRVVPGEMLHFVRISDDFFLEKRVP